MEEEGMIGWKRVLLEAQESHGWTGMYCQISMHWLLTTLSSLMIWLRGMAKSRKQPVMLFVPTMTFSLPRTAIFPRFKHTAMWKKSPQNSSRNLHLPTAVKMRRCMCSFSLSLSILSITLEGPHRQFRSPSDPWIASHVFVWPWQSDRKSSSSRIQAYYSEQDAISFHHRGKSYTRVCMWTDHILFVCSSDLMHSWRLQNIWQAKISYVYSIKLLPQMEQISRFNQAVGEGPCSWSQARSHVPWDRTIWDVSISGHNLSMFSPFVSSMGGSGGDDTSDADIASGDEFGIVLD